MRPVDPPLRGIRVVEAANYLSGPFAGLMLAQLGAEVVKVEPPGGDPGRSFGLRHGGLSAMWVNINQGKRSVVLDLKDPADRDRLHQLLAGADVFLQNWRPRVAASLGLAADEVLRAHPSLVYLSITGFGPTGPYASVPVFDTLLQAASGLAALEGTDRPTTTRSFLADKTAATFAVQAVLAALLARTRSGHGSRIDLSMLDVMAYFDFPDLCQDRTFLPPAPAATLSRGRPAVLETSDGYLAVAPVSGRQVQAACAAVGHPEWRDDLKAAGSPTELTQLLFDRLESVTRSGPTEKWLRAFLDHDVPATAVLTVDDHFTDPQTLHNEIYSEGDSPVGPVRRVRHPVRVDGACLPPVGPAPALGAEQAHG